MKRLGTQCASLIAAATLFFVPQSAIAAPNPQGGDVGQTVSCNTCSNQVAIGGSYGLGPFPTEAAALAVIQTQNLFQNIVEYKLRGYRCGECPVPAPPCVGNFGSDCTGQGTATIAPHPSGGFQINVTIPDCNAWLCCDPCSV